MSDTVLATCMLSLKPNPHKTLEGSVIICILPRIKLTCRKDRELSCKKRKNSGVTFCDYLFVHVLFVLKSVSFLNGKTFKLQGMC